jgi:hypothetical protein
MLLLVPLVNSDRVVSYCTSGPRYSDAHFSYLEFDCIKYTMHVTLDLVTTLCSIFQACTVHSASCGRYVGLCVVDPQGWLQSQPG